jgi:hypothetical protein
MCCQSLWSHQLSVPMHYRLIQQPKELEVFIILYQTSLTVFEMLRIHQQHAAHKLICRPSHDLLYHLARGIVRNTDLKLNHIWRMMSKRLLPSTVLAILRCSIVANSSRCFIPICIFAVSPTLLSAQPRCQNPAGRPARNLHQCGICMGSGSRGSCANDLKHPDSTDPNIPFVMRP